MTERHHTMTSRVRELLGTEKSYMWWLTPNPMFGDIEPVLLVRKDSNCERRVFNFIAEAYEHKEFQ
jgi:hypothetical protein